MTYSAPAPSSHTPLRIVHVVDSLEVGGLERVTANLAQAQQTQGHDVRIFSIMDTGGLKAELERAGIPVMEGHKRRSLDLDTLRRLRRCLRDARADIVHAHNFVPNYHAALASLGLPCAQVCTLHDMGARLGNRRLRTLFQLSLLRTARVAMVGSQVHDRHVATGLVKARRAHVVLNGIPVEQFVRSASQRAQARQRLGLTEQDLVIGCVGRLVPLKNHHRMIAVMPALLKKHPNLRLVIIGDGERASALRAQIASLNLGDRVIMTGQRHDVSELLCALDVFALPSQTEGLSIALLEACATGLAVVATSVGGNVEIIEDRRTGLLIPPDDNAALQAALEQAVTAPAMRQELGACAQAWVREHASVQALCHAYDTVYSAARSAP